MYGIPLAQINAVRVATSPRHAASTLTPLTLPIPPPPPPDFDVHHGNGTEACVDAVVPRTVVHHYKTPFSEGVEKFSVWRPWLDEDDSDRVFFASVQGYGPKAPGVAAFVYPGSGATCDTRAGVKDDGGVDFMGQRVDEDPEVRMGVGGIRNATGT